MTTNRTAALTLAVLLATGPTLSDFATNPITSNAAAHPTAVTMVTSPTPDTPRLSPPVEPTTNGPTSDQQSTQTWAISRFHQAHLQLPPLDIRYYPHLDDCGGSTGYFSGQPGDWQIEICTPAPYVLLHELGHAWAAHNLTPTDQEDFRQTRGLPTWRDPTIPWNQRATEHVADLIAWGVSAHHTNPLTYPTETFDDLTELFETLTGLEPLVNRPIPVIPTQ